jgi:hypothetical protein
MKQKKALEQAVKNNFPGYQIKFNHKKKKFTLLDKKGSKRTVCYGGIIKNAE